MTEQELAQSLARAKAALDTEYALIHTAMFPTPPVTPPVDPPPVEPPGNGMAFEGEFSGEYLDPKDWTVNYASQMTDGAHLLSWLPNNNGSLPPDCIKMGADGLMHVMSNSWTKNDLYIILEARCLRPIRPGASKTTTVLFKGQFTSGGDHDIWSELWLTPTPVPCPHAKHPSTESYAKGIGVEVSAAQGTKNGVAKIYVSQNGEEPFTYYWGNGVDVNAKFETAPGKINFLQLVFHWDTGAIEVWASDAGSAVMRPLFTLHTKGLPKSDEWFFLFQQVQYGSAEKGLGNPQADIVIDEVCWDGEVTQSLVYEKYPDALVPTVDSGFTNAGKRALDMGYRVDTKGATFVFNPPTRPRTAYFNIYHFDGTPVTLATGGDPAIPLPITPPLTGAAIKGYGVSIGMAKSITLRCAKPVVVSNILVTE